MLVSRSKFNHSLEALKTRTSLSLDTETTGLYPFHEDMLFSIIIADDKDAYYFNFNQYPDLPNDLLLDEIHLEKLKELTQIPTITWYIHNAKFDMAMLAREGITIAGDIHCTQTGAKVIYNEYPSYSLENCLKREGREKDDRVAEYIKQNKLSKKVSIRGKDIKKAGYELVPFDLIVEYGQTDALETYKLGVSQSNQINPTKDEFNKSLYNVMSNEKRLTKTLFEMQSIGIQVDIQYCQHGAQYEKNRMQELETRFKQITGHEMKMSPKLFKELFKDEQHKWGVTKKGSPSFAGDILKTLDHEAAKIICTHKQAKKNLDYFTNFLHYADGRGVIHSNFNQCVKTGRMSSTDPNLQNLSKRADKENTSEYKIRRAFIPREGFFFAMLDYDQIEYRMMLDYANALGLIREVLGGLDVHAATAQYANCDRDSAKTVNFLTLYGGGIQKLANALGTSTLEAKSIQQRIFRAVPEVKNFIRNVIQTAESRGYLVNWMGRRLYYPNKKLAYRGPNGLIQGGAADVFKKAMNDVHDFLADKKSRIVLPIHDELVLEIAWEESHIVEEIKGIMEGVFPYRHLPLTCGAEFSAKSLGDKVSEIPTKYGEKTRDSVQRTSKERSRETPSYLVTENPAGVH